MDPDPRSEKRSYLDFWPGPIPDSINAYGSETLIKTYPFVPCTLYGYQVQINDFSSVETVFSENN